MVELSFWNHDRVFLDPFCGSGTIPIEAAMIGKNIAPGLQRSFVSEEWPRIKKEFWKEAKVQARKSIIQDRKLNIMACDIDGECVDVSRENAFEAGVDDCITFFRKDVLDVDIRDKYGVIVCNPPYGERIGEKKYIEKLYKDMGKKFKDLDTWSIYILTSNQYFEKIYKRKADRKRKLYNGRIKVDYYQFYGPRPPKKA